MFGMQYQVTETIKLFTSSFCEGRDEGRGEGRIEERDEAGCGRMEHASLARACRRASWQAEHKRKEIVSCKKSRVCEQRVERWDRQHLTMAWGQQPWPEPEVSRDQLQGISSLDGR